MSKNTIGILGALPQEITELLKAVRNPKKIKLGSQEFIQGSILGSPVVLTLSGMGKVNAAMTTQRLISNFGVRKVIFTGVAGGINPAIAVGDILVASHTFQHDVGFLSKKLKIHPPGILPEIGMGGLEEFIFSEKLSKGEKRALSDVKKNLKKVQVGGKSHQPNLFFGTIATGDQFVASPTKKRDLARLGADAVEMEGAAVAQVARANGISALLIRAISDQAGSKSHVDFQSFLPVVAANNSVLVKAIIGRKP